MKLGQISSSASDGESRVSVDVDGELLWFSSQDVELTARPEAFASLLMFPCLKRGEEIEVPQAVCREWAEGVKASQAKWREWWNYPVLPPRAAECSEQNGAPAAGRALCFSGGIDSFYTLLCESHDITHLVYVEGYDVGLDEPARLEDIHKSLQEVATAKGVQLLTLKTNLKEHPFFNKVNWEHAHCSTLVAAGSLLCGVVGELVIPATYAHPMKKDWGSGSHTDLFWSTPFLKVVHGDSSLYRFDKTQNLAIEPLVQKHLRVCFRPRIETFNCSACEKCIRTMTALEAAGMLQYFETFDLRVPLSQRIDAIPRVHSGLLLMYEYLQEKESLNEEVIAAIGRLLARSRKKPRKSLWRVLPRFLRPRSGQA